MATLWLTSLCCRHCRKYLDIGHTFHAKSIWFVWPAKRRRRRTVAETETVIKKKRTKESANANSNCFESQMIGYSFDSAYRHKRMKPENHSSMYDSLSFHISFILAIWRNCALVGKNKWCSCKDPSHEMEQHERRFVVKKISPTDRDQTRVRANQNAARTMW